MSNYGIIIAIFMGIWFSGVEVYSIPEKELENPIQWEVLEGSNYPENLSGAFLAFSGNHLILAGGAITRDGQTSFSDKTYVKSGGDDSNWTILETFHLDHPIAYGTTVPYDNGFILIGGYNHGGPTAHATFLRYSPENGKMEKSPLPSMPEPRAFSGAVVHDRKLYVIGGTNKIRSEEASANFWVLDLALDQGRWETLPKWPGPPVLSPVVSRLYDKDDYRIFLFGGKQQTTDGLEPSIKTYAYDFSKNLWEYRADSPMPLGTVGFPVGAEHFFITSADTIPEQRVAAYHTVTDSWVMVEEGAIKDGGGAPVIVSGEALLMPIAGKEEGIKHLLTGKVIRSEAHIHPFDTVLLAVYFAFILYMGYYFSKHEKTTHDYFKGGQRLPGWAAGVSIVVTGVSAISFMSVPAKAYATNWTFLLFMISTPILAAPLVVKFVLPIFYRLNITSAYEYLEDRFNLLVRWIGSLKFVLFEIFRLGVLLFMPSLVLSVITGIDVRICIVSVGVISTVYTIMGGIEAVIWTDVLQAIIMLGGMFLAILLIFFRIGSDAPELIGDSLAMGKMQILNWTPSLSETSVLVWILTLPVLLNPYVSHQPTVQRFISTKDLRESAKSIWTAAIIGPVIIFTFFALGYCLYLYYQHSPNRLHPVMEKPDEILAWFIVSEMPIGIAGLMIGAIFAASMSSLDSSLSSLSTVITTDFYRRLKPEATDDKCLRLARVLTGWLGVLGTVIALILQRYGDVKSLLEMFISALGLFAGPISGIYLLGFFTTRANSVGVIIGVVCGSMASYWAIVGTDLHFYVYPIIGTYVTISMGYLLSLILPSKEKTLEGLTLHTT